MTSLSDHQRWLAALILEPDRLAGDPSGSMAPVALDDVDLARTRLGAYVGGYAARLAEAIEEAYPAIHAIVGSEELRALVGRYRVAAPAGVYSLTDVGMNLPAFLAGDPLSHRLPFLPDLATLEWAVLRAFHSFERERFDPASAAGWGLEAWERARLRFQPAVAVRCSAWPILDLWNLRETSPERRREIDLAVEGRPQCVLVCRDGLAVSCELVSPTKARVLGALLAGQRLGQALESLTESIDESIDVGTWFAEWTARGIVVDCRTE